MATIEDLITENKKLRAALAEIKALLAEVQGSISFTLPPVAFFINKLKRIIERAE
jgi:hypothetical protein